ncbi:MAG: hypothetical protein JWO59_2988, partial [Chloroflexi bacterium]|nr:hypothetical protein [Chloroflexota bacterium]
LRRQYPHRQQHTTWATLWSYRLRHVCPTRLTPNDFLVTLTALHIAEQLLQLISVARNCV